MELSRTLEILARECTVAKKFINISRSVVANFVKEQEIFFWQSLEVFIKVALKGFGRKTPLLNRVY